MSSLISHIPVFPFFSLFIIFLAVIAILRTRADKKDRAKETDFWKREAEANATVSTDISQLNYIHIPVEVFPTGIHQDPVLTDCEAIVNDLSGRKVLNLMGMSNTDIKLQYGAGNLAILSEADDNFALLCQTLVTWGQRLNELGFTDEAISVLEYGIGWGSDITQNYLLLGELYCQTGQFSRVDDLSEAASQLNSLTKKSILDGLAKL